LLPKIPFSHSHVAAQANDEERRVLGYYSDCLDLAFQIQDDIDDKAQIDQENAGFSYLQFVDVSAAQKRVHALRDEALQQLQLLKQVLTPLQIMTDCIIRA